MGNVRTIHGGVLLVIQIQDESVCRSPHEIPLAALDDPHFCPVIALHQLLRMYGSANCKPDSLVFRIPTSTGAWIPMIKSDYVPYFKARISGMGLEPSDFSLHGFRAGSIQQMHLVEGNIALCKIQSGHSSNAILAYSTVPTASRLDISARVSRRLARDFPPHRLTTPSLHLCVRVCVELPRLLPWTTQQTLCSLLLNLSSLHTSVQLAVP